MTACSTALTGIGRTDLPDDVFEPGEVKPVKPAKKKAPNGNPAPKKRNATEVCVGHRLGCWPGPVWVMDERGHKQRCTRDVFARVHGLTFATGISESAA